MNMMRIVTLAMPQTGEQIKLTVLGILLLAVVAALVVLLVRRRR